MIIAKSYRSQVRRGTKFLFSYQVIYTKDRYFSRLTQDTQPITHNASPNVAPYASQRAYATNVQQHFTRNKMHANRLYASKSAHQVKLQTNSTAPSIPLLIRLPAKKYFTKAPRTTHEANWISLQNKWKQDLTGKDPSNDISTETKQQGKSRFSETSQQQEWKPATEYNAADEITPL